MRPGLEVADILRAHGEEYRRLHPPSAPQEAVMRHLVQCRTAALGGHVDRCGRCGHVRISYNSCRDRHCPKCQALKKAAWLEERRERLLPVAYFHVVFTLPATLHALALGNKRVLFDLLFAAAAQTLTVLAADQKHLGAQLGFTAVLHTWSQNLQFHPHLHCVVTGGGLTADGRRWIACRSGFFLPVKVLARLFRGKFLHALNNAHGHGRLSLRGSTAELADPESWRRFLRHLSQRDWVVYAKPPFGGPEHVYRYLGRYTHRVAIANQRLRALHAGTVQFQVKDRAVGGAPKLLTLQAVEFLRRFLLHVLPRRFVRIRHFGLLAGANVATRLALAQRLLQARHPERVAASPSASKHAVPWWERLRALTGLDVFRCPRCATGRLVRRPWRPGLALVPSARAPPEAGPA